MKQNKQQEQNKKQISRQNTMDSQYSQNSEQSQRTIRQKDPILENTPINIDQSLKDKHTKLTLLNSVDVYFPYQPYDVQVTYMENVIKCLQQKQNGLLESPTGTGKTLSLLCASLGWLQKKRESLIGNKEVLPTKIIYCSRTHSQIQQVVKELRRTIYQPKIIVQGSREQYCIKKDFEMLKGGILNSACQKAITQNTGQYCKYFKGSMDEGRELFKLKMPDIEDLRIDGYNNNYCPFYHTLRVDNAVDLLFLPYNYLLDRSVSNQVNIALKNAVIIFDEAHNIHKTAEDGFSIYLNYSTLCAAETDLLNLIKFIDRGFSDDPQNGQQGRRQTPIKNLSQFDTKNFLSNSYDCHAILGPILQFKNFFKTQKQKQNNQQGQNELNNQNENIYQNVKEGDKIFEWIKINTNSTKDKQKADEVNKFMKTLDKEKGTSLYQEGLNLKNLHSYIDKANIALKDLSLGTSHYGLEIWVKFLQGILRLWQSHNYWKNKTTTFDEPNKLINDTDIMKDYKLYFDLEDADNPQINLVCLNPSLNFQKILSQEPHCILLTSGTLKPFDFWKTELKIPLDIVLENKHVIDSKKQLFSAVIKGRPINAQYGNFKQNFNFSYEKRRDEDMILDLGRALAELFAIIPNGVLVVFPSNQLMDTCKQQWCSNSSQNNQRIYSELYQQKNLYWETKSSQETQSSMNDFKLKSKTERGSAFFCVSRGKITEGIDFSDEYARAVILVGIPYPPLKNIKVQVKKDYLNEQQKNNSSRISGNEWYTQEAMRAINQSIGRVIRHIQDWGSIIFLDERFNQKDILQAMPAWCQTQTIDSFDVALIKAAQFFNDRKQITQKNQVDVRRQILEKKKQQEEEQKKEQTQKDNLILFNQSEGVQKRVFDFGQNKNNSFKQKRQQLKQNILISYEKESKQKDNQKQQERVSINERQQVENGYDSESSDSQFVGLIELNQNKNNDKIQQEKNSDQKKSDQKIKQQDENKQKQPKQNENTILNKFNTMKFLSKNQNAMSVKNSLFQNKSYFEF